MFFLLENELFSWTYLLKKTPRTTKNINISSLKWDFKNLRHFEGIQTEVQYSKNYFKNILSHEAGASGNNLDKEPQKPRPESKK